jgi:hypothetical protein
MTTHARTPMPSARHQDSARGPGLPPAACGARPPRGAMPAGAAAWPTDVEVWSWVESAVLAGYGPPVSYFL